LVSGSAGLLFLILLRQQAGIMPARDPQPPITEVVRTFTSADTVHRGDTLAGLLLRNRMGLQEIEQVLHEIRTRDYFSPRSLLPGQVLEFTRDDADRLVRLAVRCSPEEIYVFELHPDSLRSFAQAVDAETRVRKLAGTVQTTFEMAVLSAGGSAQLASKVAEIFSCEVDFFTEVRRGDRFSILVEERYVEGSFVGYGPVIYGRYEGDEAKASVAWFQPEGQRGGYYDLGGNNLRRAFLKSPLTYSRISSYFANRRFHPILKKFRPHHGVDYAAPIGTPVAAVADGTVEFAGWKGGYGRYVKIRHDRTHETCYGHMSRFASNIRAGARVKQGEKIGYVGRTGLATGPHLHYEFIENGRSINPLAMRSLPSEPIASSLLVAFRARVQDLARAEVGMASGACLIPQEWQNLIAENVAAQIGPTAD
jgi:murein DD-endopeptidase MepM/ murein hydrolase activator NlpD